MRLLSWDLRNRKQRTDYEVGQRIRTSHVNRPWVKYSSRTRHGKSVSIRGSIPIFTYQRSEKEQGRIEFQQRRECNIYRPFSLSTWWCFGNLPRPSQSNYLPHFYRSVSPIVSERRLKPLVKILRVYATFSDKMLTAVVEPSRSTQVQLYVNYKLVSIQTAVYSAEWK